ncbi:uncharacterized protein LOC18440672 isoform X1 [Amborella trichopoda]|nr:uncharacterized protein LOC18440672 isoform X1 [Amborella trichopoda]|eukprot:XP_006850873.2 uncharacterized protein LOC18440672 isoform X1 [Amborella trichopoda]
MHETNLCCCKPKNKMHSHSQMAASSHGWNFLKSLPNKLVRDVGFVIACPDLLLSSVELPTADSHMTGGSSENWELSEAWLQELDVQHLVDWFGSRKKNTRLGDHFAACIEYTLRFSPAVKLSNLIISQQINETNIAYKLDEKVPIRVPSESAEGVRPVAAMDDRDPNSLREMESILEELSLSKTGMNKQQKKLHNKLAKKKLKATPTRTVGEFDFIFSCSETHNLSKPSSIYIEKAPVLESLHLPHTKARERLDFVSHTKTRELSPDYLSATHVHHWEASVKFLLYVGPWEPFGLKTPDTATWKSMKIKEDILFESHNRMGETQVGNFSMVCLLCCFVGPHIGETLCDRKSRLSNQLYLSKNSLAASFLERTYNHSDADDHTLEKANESLKHSDGKINNDMETIQNPLTVIPGAVLKGYLFYEFELWKVLEKRRKHDISPKISDISMEFIGISLEEQGIHGTELTKSGLNPFHWIGWWANVREFETFARKSEETRWYIVPKKEWLSPVVTEVYNENILTLDELLVMAAKVAEEAQSLQIPRKRRFMVVEVRWRDVNLDLGIWVEISRGFLVEETWPGSREYRPHGYRPEQSPGLSSHAREDTSMEKKGGKI